MQVLALAGSREKRALWASMNPGSQALAAAVDEIPARRSSFTIRSCKVPNARSMRPFACGLLAQMMSMFSAYSARPNWVIPSPAMASLLFTRKMPCLSL